MPQIDGLGGGNSEQIIRTSPRKRKRVPTPAPKSSMPRRPHTRSSAGASLQSSTQPQASSSEETRTRRRKNDYDLPEDPAPKSKKVKVLTRKAHQSFGDAPSADLPAPEADQSSSPAQGTRHHKGTHRVNGQGVPFAEKTEQGASTLKRPTRKIKNFIAEAAEASSELESSQLEVAEAHESPNRGGRPPIMRTGKSSRPLKVKHKKSSTQPAPAEHVPGEDDSPGRPASESNEDDAEHLEEEAQNSGADAESDEASSTADQAKKRTTKSKLNANEISEALENVKDAVTLYECNFAWTKVFVHAKKMVASSRTAKHPGIREIMEVIRNTKAAYNTIYQQQAPEDALEEVENEIVLRTENLESLVSEHKAAKPRHHEEAFVKQLHDQIIPRMLMLIKTALATRWNDKEKSMSIESLEELVGLMNTTILFRGIAEKATHKPKALENEHGELILSLAREAMAHLKTIRATYIRIINEQHAEAASVSERKRKLEALDQEKRRNAEFAQRREQQRTAHHRQILREYAEREEERARALAEEITADQTRWNTDLTMRAKRGDLQAQRLCKKLGFVYYQRNSRAAGQARETVIDVDDFDDADFDLNSDFEPVSPRPTPKPNGVRRARPRPHRELTEDIPAPATSPKWTERQNLALLWGLETFLGADRYEKILNAPEVGGLVRGMDVVDLMQQALRLKQHMARVVERSPREWEWLSSVRKSDEVH